MNEQDYGLPPGFKLDEPTQVGKSAKSDLFDLPPGFTIDTPSKFKKPIYPDKDTFLSDLLTGGGVNQGRWLGGDIRKAVEPFTDPRKAIESIVGAGEAGMNLATGIPVALVSTVAKPIAQVGAAWSGGNPEKAGQAVDETLGKAVYQPTTVPGQALSEAAMAPISVPRQLLQSGAQEMGASPEAVAGVGQAFDAFVMLGGLGYARGAVGKYVDRAMKTGEPLKAEIIKPAIMQGDAPPEVKAVAEKLPDQGDLNAPQTATTMPGNAPPTASNVAGTADLEGAATPLRGEPPAAQSAPDIIKSALGEVVNPKPAELTPEEARQAEAATVPTEVNAGLNPMPIVKTFVEQDLAPTLEKVKTIVTDSAKDIKNAVIPTAASAQAGRAGEIIRAGAAGLQRTKDVGMAALKSVRNLMERLSPTIKWDFVAKAEGGVPHPDQRLAEATRVFQDMLNQDVDDVHAIRPDALQHVIENYFPHIWKDPKKAAEFYKMWLAKRPLQGSKSFLKHRTLPTIADGMKPVSEGGPGLEPISENPIDLILMKHGEMQKFVMGQKVLKQYKDEGLIKFVSSLERAPDGWKLLDDRSATVVAPPDLQYKSPSGAQVGQNILGHYYAPEAVARVFNNYLSPGLRGKPLFRAYLGMGNVMNQAQLGLSLFHLGFTSIDAMTSKLALALGQMSHGDIGKGLKSIAQVPIAPVENIIKGGKMAKEWNKPGSQDVAIQNLVNSMVTAGGRAGQDSWYDTGYAHRAADALRRGNPLTALRLAPGALTDAFSTPMMKVLVPRQKMGVFADLAQYEMERLSAKGASDAEITTALTKIWNSVDNRMGQLVYDNLFWNKALKDLGMASVRSLGWNLGTVRELGGSLVDLINQGKGIVKGKKPEMTYKMQYAAALPILVGTMGATICYLATGKGPQSLKDYFYPPTGGVDEQGRPRRMSLPSYMKDVYHYSSNFMGTLVNKANPLLGAIIDMLNNKDYYGAQIIDKEKFDWTPAGIWSAIKDVGTYGAKQFIPLSARNARRADISGGTTLSKIVPFVGVVPAPADVNMTKAEKVMADYYKSQRATGAVSHDEQETRDLKNQAVINMRQGRDVPQDVIGKLTDKLSQKQWKNLGKRANPNPFETKFPPISLKESLPIYSAASPEERDQLFPMMFKKVNNFMKDPGIPGAQKMAMWDKLQKAGWK